MKYANAVKRGVAEPLLRGWVVGKEDGRRPALRAGSAHELGESLAVAKLGATIAEVVRPLEVVVQIDSAETFWRSRSVVELARPLKI